MDDNDGVWWIGATELERALPLLMLEFNRGTQCKRVKNKEINQDLSRETCTSNVKQSVFGLMMIPYFPLFKKINT